MTLDDIHDALVDAIDIMQKYEKATEGRVPSSPYALLAMIRMDDKPNSRVTDIAKFLGITQQAVGKMLRGLQKADLVNIRTDESDRRARLASLTDEGEHHLRILIRSQNGEDHG